MTLYAFCCQLLQEVCRRLHHIYTICVIYHINHSKVIIHVIIWHPMVITIAIVFSDCDCDIITF